MRRPAMISCLLLGAVLALPPGATAVAGEGRRAAMGEQQWLSIAQVHARLEAAGYRKIEKIEREHGAYEVRATDPKGERIKLQVNPRTGEPLARPAAGERLGDGTAARPRDPADCNKRRCRDDLPQVQVQAQARSGPAPASK